MFNVYYALNIVLKSNNFNINIIFFNNLLVYDFKNSIGKNRGNN